MKKKKIAGIFLAAAMCLMAVTGCSSESPAEADNGGDSSSAEGSGAIGILVVSTGSQWCNDIIDSVSAAVEKEGYEVIVSDSQTSADNELSGMENLINAGCEAIVVNSMNPAGLADICKEAQDQGIYIIGWSDLLENYDALVVEDPAAEAEMIAGAITDYIDETENEGCEMATIWLADAANPDTTAGVFKEALEAEFEETLVQGKNVNIVNSQYASDTTNAMNTAEAILAANPDVKVIFCQSDEMGVAVAQTLESSGIGADDIMVCGLDGSSEAISTIAGGQSTLRSTVFADTTTVGTKVGESICNYLSGGEAEDVVAEYALVNRENASEYMTE